MSLLSSLALVACTWPCLLAPFSLIDDYEMISLTSPRPPAPNLVGHRSLPRWDFGYMTIGRGIEMGRFQPGFYVYRLPQFWLLGDEPFFYRCHHYLLGGFSAGWLWLILGTLGFGLPARLLAVFLLLSGEHAFIWVRLGASETVGIFFLLLAVHLLLSEPTPRSSWRSLGSVLAFLASATQKESFAALTPGMMWLALTWPRCRHGASWRRALSATKWTQLGYLLSLVFVLAGAVAATLRNGQLFTYVEPSDPAQVVTIVRANLTAIFPLAPVAVALALTAFHRRQTLGRDLRSPLFACGAVGIALWLFSQLITYRSIWIDERYRLPGLLAYFVLSAGCVHWLWQRRCFPAAIIVSGFCLWANLDGMSRFRTDSAVYAAECEATDRVCQLAAALQPRAIALNLPADPLLSWEPAFSMSIHLADADVRRPLVVIRGPDPAPLPKLERSLRKMMPAVHDKPALLAAGVEMIISTPDANPLTGYGEWRQVNVTRPYTTFDFRAWRKVLGTITLTVLLKPASSS